MPETEYNALLDLINTLQSDMTEVKIAIARLEQRCSWKAGVLGLLGGAIPVLTMIAMHYLFPAK